jgi:hypothetical protein
MLEPTKEKFLMFLIWENSLHYGPNSKIYEKIKNRFFENVPDFIFGTYSVIFCMSLGLSRDIKRSMVSVFILEILEHFQ